MLSEKLFKTIVEHAPLFAMDFVVVNENHELLVGKRLNAPAKNWWFVPGGRVFKGETLSQAFERLTKQELGVSFNIEQAARLGLYEHFYNDSVFGKNINTHYINSTYYLNIDCDKLNLPYQVQHETYRWIPICQVESDQTIHKYSKVFLSDFLATVRFDEVLKDCHD